MKIAKIIIHNIRSILDCEFNLKDYSLIIGENNSGKTTIINAIRLFYEHDGLKYKEARDFPKLKTNDNESWVEIWFSTTNEEQENLKEEYRSADRILKVRRYFLAEDKTKRNNYYGYENGELTFANQFYGATQVGQGKLGKVLYIPALSKTDDGLKMSGPSPLREMVNFIFENIVENNEAYAKLIGAFDEFNEEVNQEDPNDNYTIGGLTKDINKEIEQFGLEFGLNINKIKPSDIVKNLVTHFFNDSNLDGEIDDVTTLGQGVQRHLIFALIKLSTKYTKEKVEKKKEFSPNFSILLFEEPEAFLHPSQQEQLNLSLRLLSQIESQQVLLTTHSSVFVSRNISDILSLIKIGKLNGQTNLFQLSKASLDSLMSSNAGLYQHFCNCLLNSTIPEEVKTKIRRQRLGDDTPDYSDKLFEEGMKYFLWVNAERSALFFARHVIICEGASEKIYLDYLLEEEWPDLKKKHIYILDALGKYNLHRFMNLLGSLGIEHCVIYDKDQDRDIHSIINQFIESSKNPYTKGTYAFEVDFEDFLGIPKPNRDDLKPLNIIKNHKEGRISEVKRGELKSIIEGIM